MAKKIKVLIADDHALLREGLRKILELEGDITVVGEAGDGREAVDMAEKLRPDVILMDINMPQGGGLAATREIKERLPEIDVIVLTIHDAEEYVVELINAGAKGYMLKDVEPARVVDAIRRVHEGEAFIPSDLMARVFRQFGRSGLGGAGLVSELRPTATITLPEPLTEREQEILQLIVDGHTNKEIGQKLFISEKTVKNHITHILSKLDLSDRTQAAVFAIKHSMVRIG